jgi:hypothetical protein
MATTPNTRAGSPRESSSRSPHLTVAEPVQEKAWQPPSPEEPRHTFRTLCGVRLLLEDIERYLKLREPFANHITRPELRKLRAAVQAHIANLVIAADHEACLDDLDTLSLGGKGGAS